MNGGIAPTVVSLGTRRHCQPQEMAAILAAKSPSVHFRGGAGPGVDVDNLQK